MLHIHTTIRIHQCEVGLSVDSAQEKAANLQRGFEQLSVQDEQRKMFHEMRRVVVSWVSVLENSQHLA